MVVVVESGVGVAFLAEKDGAAERGHGVECKAALIAWALPIFDASVVEEANDRKVVVEVLRDGVAIELAGGLVVNEQAQTAQALDVDCMDVSNGVCRSRVFEQIEDLGLQ